MKKSTVGSEELTLREAFTQIVVSFLVLNQTVARRIVKEHEGVFAAIAEREAAHCKAAEPNYMTDSWKFRLEEEATRDSVGLAETWRQMLPLFYVGYPTVHYRPEIHAFLKPYIDARPQKIKSLFQACHDYKGLLYHSTTQPSESFANWASKKRNVQWAFRLVALSIE